MNILTRASILIILLGFSIAMPGIDSLLIDFTQVGDDAMILMQLGVVLTGIAFFLGGDL